MLLKGFHITEPLLHSAPLKNWTSGKFSDQDRFHVAAGKQPGPNTTYIPLASRGRGGFLHRKPPPPPQKTPVRRPFTPQSVARAFLSPPDARSRLRWGIHRRRIERPAQAAARTSESSEMSGRGSESPRGPGGPPREGASGGRRVRGRRRSRSRKRQPLHSELGLATPPLAADGGEVAADSSGGVFSSNSHSAAGFNLTKVDDMAELPFTSQIITATPLPASHSAPAAQGILVQDKGVSSPAGMGSFASHLPDDSLVALTQPESRGGGGGGEPHAPRNGFDCRMLLPIGAGEVVQYRVDARRRLPMGLHLSSDVNTLGTHNTQSM